jgi:outer membrane protein insertion porin family
MLRRPFVFLAVALFVAALCATRCGVCAAEETAPAAQPSEPTPAAVPAPAPAPQGQPEAAPPKIAAIEIRGNQHIDQSRVLAAVKSAVGQPYDAAQAQQDADAIKALGWFYRAEASTQPEAGGVRLIFQVFENPVIPAIEFEGNTIFPADQLRAVMKTKPGDVMNSGTIVEDAQAIEKKYSSAGYAFAQVMDLSFDPKTGALRIPIAEGIVEQIKAQGNSKTHTWIVLRNIRTKPGDIVNMRRLRRDLERLLNTELFQDARVNPEPGTKPGYVILTFNVQERKTGMVNLGVGYSSVQKIVGFIDYAEANLRGSAQRISIRTEFGGRDSVELGYYNPYAFPSDTSLNTALYNKLILRQAFWVDDVTHQEKTYLYDERRTGGSITVSRSLSDITRAFLTLRSDDISVRERADNPLPSKVVDLQSAQVRSLGASLRQDSRDIIMDPTRGAYNSLSLEVAGLIAGGSKFQKYSADLRRYWKAGKKNVIASRLLLGITTGDPPPLEQFLLGGSESLRGYRNDRFPGRKMALLNTEFRFPVASKMKGVLFIDIGDAWGGEFAKDYGDKSFNLHVGYGVGLRVVTPIGPLRLDFGIGEFGNETHFSVGHVF